MKLFVLNAGSSSLKYTLFEVTDTAQAVLWGFVEKIGEQNGKVRLEYAGKTFIQERKIPDHESALNLILVQLKALHILKDFSMLDGCIHRVVHGGSKFIDPVLIDEAVIKDIKALFILAPLHNPANLAGIEAIAKIAPDLPQVAVFDTAFHQSMPAVASYYALPQKLAQKQEICRYGFHGISHKYLTIEAAKMLGKTPDDCNLITLHLGNGASVTAVKNGKSIDTSMGFTPMEGLVMGTRCGDLDVGVVLYLMEHTGINAEQIDAMLNHESGLQGLCGTNDMREILERKARGDNNAMLAFMIFCYRIKKYIGAYTAILGSIDALVFSGGIGENSPEVRSAVCTEMAHLGIVIDEETNNRSFVSEMTIGDRGAAVEILVIKTDEALQMARDSIPVLGRSCKILKDKI